MKIKIKKENAERLDSFLSKKFVQYSRSFIQKIIKDGKVLVDSKMKSPGYVIKENEIVEINIPPKEEKKDIVYKEDQLNILFEDEEVLIIEKTAGLVTYPAGKEEISVLGILRPKIQIKGEERPGIVHRLDRDTSGIMLVAKVKDAEDNLKGQFKARSIEKGYIALIFGHLTPKAGQIIIPIERGETNRIKRTVAAEGKEAITDYKVIEYISHEGREYTLVDVTILTGRTHQIRVHFEAIGHPLVGDKDYTKNDLKKFNEKEGYKRQFLHAYKLGFNHPKTGKWMAFKSDLPKDLQEILKKLKT